MKKNKKTDEEKTIALIYDIDVICNELSKNLKAYLLFQIKKKLKTEN